MWHLSSCATGVCALVTCDMAPLPPHVVSLSVSVTQYAACLDSTDALHHSNNWLAQIEQHMCSSAVKSQQQTEQAVETPWRCAMLMCSMIWYVFLYQSVCRYSNWHFGLYVTNGSQKTRDTSTLEHWHVSPLGKWTRQLCSYLLVSVLAHGISHHTVPVRGVTDLRLMNMLSVTAALTFCLHSKAYHQCRAGSALLLCRFHPWTYLDA